ncbi:MAG: DUF4388 domain-containing protein [Thermodesulfobacteriota bacterium]
MNLKEEIALAGRFRFLSLGEVLQMLGTAGCTGELRMYSRYAREPGLVYFSRGLPVNARAQELTGIDALYSLFGWLDGEFEFYDTVTVTVERTINMGLMEIVMDGARLLDDGQVKVLGPDTGTAQDMPEAERPAKKKPKLKGIPIIRLPFRNQKLIALEDTFERGEVVAGRNGAGAFLCLILEGFANVFKESEGGQIRICRLGPGALVGNIPAVTKTGSGQSISAVAAGAVKVGVFDASKLNADFARMSYQLRRILVSLDNRFVQVSDRVVEANSPNTDFRAFAANARTLIPQGDRGAGAQLITEGSAFVVRRSEEGIVPLARLSQGDFVGHVPFFSIGHEPNAAEVLVTANFKGNHIDTDRMQAEYDLLSPIVKHFVDHLTNCVSVTTMVACDLIEPVGSE